MQHILAVDMGGTHSRFAHFILENGVLYKQGQHICRTASISHTEQALHEASLCASVPLEEMAVQVWGVAGPVHASGLCAILTNAALHLDFSKYMPANRKKEYGHILLLNDFSLQAWATLAEQVQCIHILPMSENNEYSRNIENKNTTHEVALTRAVLGAGTGLGTAALVPCGRKGWTVLHAEAGHTGIPLYEQDEKDFALFAADFLQQKRLSAEDILSARGLSLLHAFVHGESVSPAQAAQLLCHNDAQGTSQESAVLQLYARFLGRFCRQWLLSTMSVGGLYLGGGVLMKNPSLVRSASFRQEFYTLPRSMQHAKAMFEAVPIVLMQEEYAGLWGAAHMAKDYIQKN